MTWSSHLADPYYMASSYVLVAEPQWFGSISVLWGTTGSCLKRTVAAPKEVSEDDAIASVIAKLKRIFFFHWKKSKEWHWRLFSMEKMFLLLSCLWLQQRVWFINVLHRLSSPATSHGSFSWSAEVSTWYRVINEASFEGACCFLNSVLGRLPR